MKVLLSKGVFLQVSNCFIIVALFIVPSFFLSSRKSLAKDDYIYKNGLDLQNNTSKMRGKKNFYDNPHLELECSECHKKSVTKKTQKKSAKLKFKDVVKLCNSCHEGESLHPVGINPYKSKPKIVPPKFLPLAKKGKYKKKIVCTTCHEIHLDKTDNHLLRGFKGSSASFTYLKKYQDFCISCHKLNLVELSPHSDDESRCIFCHEDNPADIEEKSIDAIRPDIIRRCNFCHMKLEGAHFLTVNPFADKALQEDIPYLKLPLINGKITCVTCHSQHDETELPHKLREEFVRFAERSVRIDPHWKGTFCLTCHDEEPKEGEAPTFLLDGDIIMVCNRCHKSDEATSDIHPVGMTVKETDAMTIPEEFPLQDGVLTCSTCHDLKMQAAVNDIERERNSLFLRGGPYESRTQLCIKCHKIQSYKTESPHVQIDDNGDILDTKCLYCHSSRPDIKIIGIRPKMFKGDASNLCYDCHPDRIKRHPFGIDHQGVAPSDEKMDCISVIEDEQKMELPLYEDAMFCGTCHNSHQEGVLKGIAIAGSGKRDRLRLPEGHEMCVACHCERGVDN
jgi:hypothetical protein